MIDNNDIMVQEKETIRLFKAHNKKTKFPLEIEEIEYPAQIIRILKKKSSDRTNLQKEKLTRFRNSVRYELNLKSQALERQYYDELREKKRQRAIKCAQTKEINNQKNPSKYKHFGIWLDKKETDTLSRNNYAKVNKKVSHNPDFYVYMKSTYPKSYENMFENESCTIYTDEWCLKHREDCLHNFDLNMKYFSSLNEEAFNKELSRTLKKFKKLVKIDDLTTIDEDDLCGVYILVLGEYKQMYVGQTTNVKRRIKQHWGKNKEFDRLICGRINESRLSIDCFGPLDTTEIYFFHTYDTEEVEKKLTSFIKDKYLINRVSGGISGDAVHSRFTAIELSANRKKRKLSDD